MWNSLRSLLCGSMLCCALGATSADAATGRTQFFTFACNGQQQAITFAVGQLGNNTNRFIQGAEITLSDTQPGLQFVLLQAGGGSNSTLVSIGRLETHVSRDYNFSTFPVTTDNVGNVLMTLTGQCQGSGAISGFVTIIFFS